MFDQKRREACWAACGAGLNIDMSDVVESEKIWNSRMSSVPSMVLVISLDMCERAIISALWLEALLARGTLWENMTWPAWMPVTAQPVALSVFDPLVKTQRVLRLVLVVSHTASDMDEPTVMIQVSPEIIQHVIGNYKHNGALGYKCREWKSQDGNKAFWMVDDRRDVIPTNTFCIRS